METPPNKRGLRAETYARVRRTQMLQLQGIAEDVAALALFLASDDARSITSEIVSCNGGNRMWEDS